MKTCLVCGTTENVMITKGKYPVCKKDRPKFSEYLKRKKARNRKIWEKKDESGHSKN